MEQSFIQEEEEYVIDIHDLNFIRDKIEAMNKFNQVEVLRIMNKKKAILNENKYGVHVNMTDLSKQTIDELKVFINYVNNQELSLSQIEQQKESFKNIYFTKDNKEITAKLSKK